MPDRRPDGDAVVFPGQGSQHPDMRARVADIAPDLLARVCELVGDDPFARLDGGTRFIQPAVFCAGIAGWREWGPRLRPTAFAGHSFGELAALVAAGALSEADALELVVLRGRLTDEVATAAGGGLLAVLGVGPARAQELADRHRVAVANDNCPGQVVLSGREGPLVAAAEDAERLGVQVRRLDVSGPFHSPWMAPAVAPFARALAGVAFRRTDVPVYSGTTAAPFGEGEPQGLLAEALVSPVRWRETVERLGTIASRVVEMPPGDVLSKMVRRTLRGTRRLVVDPAAS